MKLIKPKALKIGDTIGLVTPAGIITAEKLDAATQKIENAGFKVKLGSSVMKRHGYFAGTDKERAEELHEMFLDSEVNAIQCVRGGYGTMRFLDLLDFELIRQHPKIFMGYSDISVLLNVIHEKTGLVTFHGPMGVTPDTQYNKAAIQSVLMNAEAPFVFPQMDSVPTPNVLVSGKAKGQVAGGNIAVLAALCGTEYQPDFSNKIVFLEDVGELPYRIDRMLAQMRMAGCFDGAKAIVHGIYAGCETEEPDRSFSLNKVLTDEANLLGLPTVYGHVFGHIDNNFVLPIGAECELKTDGGVIFTESAVEAVII